MNIFQSNRFFRSFFFSTSLDACSLFLYNYPPDEFVAILIRLSRSMSDPSGAHITRIYVNCPRQSPSPIRSTNTAPVCTSTPIINVGASHPSPKQQMARLAREILASQRSSETYIQKCESPPQEKYLFVSKDTGQQIDPVTGEGIGTILPSTTETAKKTKKKRQSLAVVPPPNSNRTLVVVVVVGGIHLFLSFPFKARRSPAKTATISFR